MKRFYLSLAVFIGLLAICGFALLKIAQTKEEVETMLERITSSVESGDLQSAQRLSDELIAYWIPQEHKLIRYIRHGELDTITLSLSRLPSLIRYENLSEFLAEINQVQTVLNHIWDSEIPVLRNIL